MKVVRIVAVALAALAPLLVAPLALAQVPPHRPGEVCVTPRLWCWQRPPGPVGTGCACMTPYGPIQGRLQ